MGKRKVDDNKDYAEMKDGSIWVTVTGIAKTEARRRWPHRKIEGLPDPKLDGNVTDSDYIAEVHFGAVDLEKGSTETFRVELGDLVEVEADAGLLWVGEVLEMFQTTEKERLFVAKWMYTHINASAATRRRGAQPPAPWPLDEGALFRALQDDSKPVTSFNLAHTIVRVVEKHHQAPGGPIPQDFDCYWSMQHDWRYNRVWNFHGNAPDQAPRNPTDDTTMGSSCLCSTGQLGESEAAGSRPSMVSQEVLRAIAHIKQQDPVQAEALERTLQIAESGLSHILGAQILQENNTMRPVYAPDSDAESVDEDDEWEGAEGEAAGVAMDAEE